MKNKSNFSIIFDKIFPEGKMTERIVVYLSLSLLFFISATYSYWFGDGIFFYQENSSLFIFSGEYFQKFTVIPGGLLTYAGNFLTQGFISSLYGSLIVSTLLILVSIVFIKIYKRLSGDRSFSLLFILLPSCSLLLLQTHYNFLMQHNLGFLLVAVWFLVSIVLANKNLRFVMLGLYPLLFYLVGSYALIYLASCFIFSIIYERGVYRYYFPVFLILIALLTFILFKEVLFLQPIDRLLAYPLIFKDSKLTTYMSLLVGYFILFPIIIKVSGLFIVNKNFTRVINLATILTIFPLIVYLLYRNYDPDTARLIQIEKLVYKQDWDAIIKKQERLPLTNVIGQYYYNLALSEKGQLCNRMFFGRQNFGPMSLSLPRDNEHANRAVYFYYNIGLISEAHHLAYEVMVQHGYSPENIKMLIKTELINGNYKIAERYINVLKKTFHYKRWADKYEKMLFKPALINSDPELGEKIRLLPKRDFFIVPDDEQTIDLFLKDNPDNRRAFEYKIARKLLEKDLLATVIEVKKMKEIGYTYIPRHIEEAVVAFATLTKEVPDLGGLTVNPDTEQRFIQYRLVSNSYGGNKSQVEKGMKNTEKNTFWYYLQYTFINRDF